LATTEFYKGDIFDDEYDIWYEANKDKLNINSKGEKHFISSELIENMPKYSWFWTNEAKDKDPAWVVFSIIVLVIGSIIRIRIMPCVCEESNLTIENKKEVLESESLIPSL